MDYYDLLYDIRVLSRLLYSEDNFEVYGNINTQDCNYWLLDTDLDIIYAIDISDLHEEWGDVIDFSMCYLGDLVEMAWLNKPLHKVSTFGQILEEFKRRQYDVDEILEQLEVSFANTKFILDNEDLVKVVEE